MKEKLIVQSLSPLALLTIVRNFSFVTKDTDGIELCFKDFISENIVLLIVMVFCAIWVLLALWFLLEFKAFHYADTIPGYEIEIIEEKQDASLNFFLTLILPLVIDDVQTWQGASVFIIILLLIFILLAKTNLFYANPVLSILGYHVYKFKFKQNTKFPKEYIAVAKKLEKTNPISYKEITKNESFEDTIFYIERN